MDIEDDIACGRCGRKDGFNEEDGLFYCRSCFTQADDMMETDYQYDDLDNGNRNYHHSVHRLRNVTIKTEPVTLLSQSETQQTGFWKSNEYKTPKEEDIAEELCIPNDFGFSIDASQLSVEVLSSEIRIRYIMGVQLMIQFQCQVLVEKYGVSPLICGLAGVIWMRFVVASRVFDEDWADKTFEDSELQYTGFSEERITQSRRGKGICNMYGQSGVMIWFRSLRKRIPISSSLAVSFLACHIAREPILPTDIYTWSLEGKLPYLTAFIEIEKHFGPPSSACPLSSSIMFKPFKVVGSRELESQSGFVAQSIGLQLPPVNFFAIARRYIKQLSLPQEKILPHAVRIYEWSMPPDLWLSANPKRLPTRVCVMSIILLTIRLLYNINGFGKWEASLPMHSISSYARIKNGDAEECSQSSDIRCRTGKTEPATPKSNKRKSVSKECSQSFKSKEESEKINNNSTCSRSKSSRGSNNATRGMLDTQDSDFDTAELLCSLEAIYEKADGLHEYSKDLPTYLKYCKNVVFAGLKPLVADYKEETTMAELWNFYEHQEDTEVVINCHSSPREKRSLNNRRVNGVSMSDDVTRKEPNTPITSAHDGSFSTSMHCSQAEDSDSSREQDDQKVQESKAAALKRMKLNMEENGFCYIPARVKMKRYDHLHYIRKNDGGTRSYVAHADYYILLRACAQVAQVGVRYMHAGALKLEKRLSWIENRIDQSLHFRFQNPPPQSSDDVGPPKEMDDLLDHLDFNLAI